MRCDGPKYCERVEFRRKEAEFQRYEEALRRQTMTELGKAQRQGLDEALQPVIQSLDKTLQRLNTTQPYKQQLPASWRTIYELSKLPPEVVEESLALECARHVDAHSDVAPHDGSRAERLLLHALVYRAG